VIEQARKFAAPRYVAFGIKRTCRDDLLFVRFRGKADVGCEPALIVLAAFDPKRT
jgi:hypothetical protein